MTLADRDLLDAPAPHRWTFDDYMRAAEAGIFDAQPVELIEGELIDMPAQKELTAWIISRLVGKLDSVFPEPYWIKIKATQRLSNFTAPEPDVTILSGPPCPPAAEPPRPLLIIEVSDTTPVWDQTTKASLYASYGISDYWVIDANLKQVEVFRGPMREGSQKYGWRFKTRNVFNLNDRIAPLCKPEASLEVFAFLS